MRVARQHTSRIAFSARMMHTDQYLEIYRSLSLPPPKKETLSRHLFFGTNGLQGQWLGPSAEIKVNFLLPFSPP